MVPFRVRAPGAYLLLFSNARRMRSTGLAGSCSALACLPPPTSPQPSGSAARYGRSFSSASTAALTASVPSRSAALMKLAASSAFRSRPLASARRAALTSSALNSPRISSRIASRSVPLVAALDRRRRAASALASASSVSAALRAARSAFSALVRPRLAGRRPRASAPAPGRPQA